MQTQISVLVKNESLLSRFMSWMWFINIFKKMSVNCFLDGSEEAQVLKARKEPYLIDVEPGVHEIMFTDPRAKSKNAFRSATGALVGGAFGLAAGGSSAISGAMIGAQDARTAIHDSAVQCTLQEGDVLRLSVKPKNNGSVKVKVLKK